MRSSQNYSYEEFIDGTSANRVSAKFRTFLFHDVGEITSSEKVKKVAGACGHLFIQLL
jgi:hypothetical protein